LFLAFPFVIPQRSEGICIYVSENHRHNPSNPGADLFVAHSARVDEQQGLP